MIFLNVSFYVNPWLCPSADVVQSHIFVSCPSIYMFRNYIYTSAKEKYNSSTYILDQAVKSIVSA